MLFRSQKQYYWGVQAIDTAFAGSEFSTETSFIVGAPEISVIASQSTSEGTTINTINFTITDTSSSPCSLTITFDSSDTVLLPNENISYDCDSGNYTITAIPSAGQSGSSTITVTAIAPDGLTSSTSFDLDVFALPVISSIDDQESALNHPIRIPFQLTDTEGGNMILSASTSNTSLITNENISFTGTNITTDGSSYTLATSPGVPENITMNIVPSNGITGNSTLTIQVDDNGAVVEQSFGVNVLLFTENRNITLPGVYSSSVSFGDYDNDGDLDILIIGNTGSSKISKVYRNTEGNFSLDTGITITGVHEGAATFGDYDNDEDLDILITGNTGFSYFAEVYRNTGGSFNKDTNINLTGINNSSVSFVDYNNDGDLDIFIIGNTGSNNIAKVYRNNDGNYSEDTGIIFPGTYSNSISFGDYDNDGDLDLFITGNNGSTMAKIYQNTGDNFIEDTGIVLPGVYRSSVAFGDYDNDGDLDILITGETGSGRISKVYRNSECNFNEDIDITLPGVDYSSTAFGDYDNDGDLDILITVDTGSEKFPKYSVILETVLLNIQVFFFQAFIEVQSHLETMIMMVILIF